MAAGVIAAFSYGPSAASGETPAVLPSCDRDESVTCLCMGDPGLGELWCESFLLAVQPDCWNDGHCNL
jgi:hypothetical protein